jgi:mycofactocin system glycosyltransferase
MSRTNGGVPSGWTLTLDEGARRTDRGRVLIGGAPLRVLRLTPGGAAALDDFEAGQPLPAEPARRALARRLVDAGLAIPHPPPDAGPSLGDVAVVIPVRDMPDGLATTIASLGPVAEVIVVDDGSRDPVAIRTAAGTAQVLRNERSQGPAAARERGWRSTRLDVVAFVDAEVNATRTSWWLAELLPHLNDGQVGAVAPRVRPTPGTAPPVLAAYEELRSALDLGSTAAVVRPHSRVPYVPTTALVVRRDALESVDGFDIALRVGEDVDFVWRLHEHGWRVHYDPRVEVTHPSRPSFAAWTRQRISYGTSAAPLADRHGSAVRPLQISGWSALAWAAFGVGQPAVGLGIGAGTAAALVPKLRSLSHPVREAIAITGRGNLWAGRSVVEALRRPWWPIAIGAAIMSRRMRPAIAAAVFVPPLLEWRAQRPSLRAGTYVALRLLDDLAYGAGVWLGSARTRSAAALLPSFTSPIGASPIRTAAPDLGPGIPGAAPEGRTTPAATRPRRAIA